MDLVVGLGIAAALLLVLLTWQLLRGTPRLEIGERGIRDRGFLGSGWIRWEEIEGVYQRRSQEGDAVFLRLRATERLVRRLRRRGNPGDVPAVGSAFDVRLDLSDSEFSAVEVVQEIMAHASPPSRAPQWPGAPTREQG